MSRLVSRAESWEKVYTAFSNINFAAFDYNSIKQSLLDYIRLHFPESFNDFIESSEFIAIIETFAYIAEQMAYRIDVVAHENFISTAQRRDSILRLAKLVSYTAARPLPARGLVKITSISTTENVVDSNGIDLASTTIRWNDTNNANWKDQFILLMNRVMQQEFGSVGPNDRFQIQDVLFEIYEVGLVPMTNGVFKYTANSNSTSLPMELVPVEYDETSGIVERRPHNNSNFTWLYASDGLGDSSETTGFLCFTKQGTLQKYRTTFDGVTPNQWFDIPATNVNDIDVWLNNINPTTGETLDLPNPFSYRPSWYGKSGEWNMVDLAFSQNVIFNTNPNRNKYEVETRDENRVRLIFGDGEYADVPSGTFEVWVRTSVDENTTISQSSVTNVPVSFTYLDTFGRVQTFTFTFSLIGSLQNASAAETDEHIRITAPAVYYTQDRMVNAQDYNTFMLQDPSILKLRSVNRTFAGDSKYMPWHDASETYENVKLFGDDGILYFQDKSIDQRATNVVAGVFDPIITNLVEPLLSSTDILVQLTYAGVPIGQRRTQFTTAERNEIIAALTSYPDAAHIYYNKNTYVWHTIKSTDDPNLDLPGTYPGDYIVDPLITVTPDVTNPAIYVVTRQSRHLVFESPTTAFWSVNDANAVIDYDTATSVGDTITVLKANSNHNDTRLLQQNWIYDIIGQESIDAGIGNGLTDEHRLSILPVDENDDGLPDNLNPNSLTYDSVADIINYKIEIDLDSVGLPYTVSNLPYFINGQNDTSTLGGVGVSGTEAGSPGDIVNEVTITSGTGVTTLIVNTYVYFSRPSTIDVYVPIETNYENIQKYVNSINTGDGLVKRHNGRGGLNFAWFHYSPKYYLVDPSPSNIIDTFIITRGYFTDLKRWLEDPLATQPLSPTPLSLRTSYGYLLDNKMISDTVVLHPGKFKLLFGAKAAPELQATFKIVRSPNGLLTDNQVKTSAVTAIRNFFDVGVWEFGESFYFTELAASIHAALSTEISSVVLVPRYSNNQFGDMFQLFAGENEIFYPDVTVDQIEIVAGYNAANLRLNG